MKVDANALIIIEGKNVYRHGFMVFFTFRFCIRSVHYIGGRVDKVKQ